MAENGNGTTRQRLNAWALIALCVTGLVLSLVVAGPFLPGLTWALAFAVVAGPIFDTIARRVNRREIAAGLTVVTVALMLVLPAGVTAWQLGNQAAESLTAIRQTVESGTWKRILERNQHTSQIVRWVDRNFDLDKRVDGMSDNIENQMGNWMAGAVEGVIQLLIALFALFYFLRDREAVLGTLQRHLPLSESEAGTFFERIRGMTYATVYGTLVVSAVQGGLGGLMFWILGLPTPLLWGVAMAILSVFPVLGAFVIWAPAAGYLAMQGAWIKAGILVVWGLTVVSTIDNLLYPMLVGKQIRMHTLAVFVAVVGGLFVFGGAGLVLGPVIFAATYTLIQILRARTFGGNPAEQPAVLLDEKGVDINIVAS